MSHWLDQLQRLAVEDADADAGSREPGRRGEPCVLVSVVQTRGSCPRNIGTRMVVTASTSHGTIGGGHLEYQAMDIARRLLCDESDCIRLERFPLGARVGQCCGGLVHLSFERLPARQPAWVNRLIRYRREGQVAVLVSALPGHAAAGKKLLVGAAGDTLGSLDSPALQRVATARGLRMARDGDTADAQIDAGLLYERVAADEFHIAVFGAGHVGQALVSVAAHLPCRITWIDSRASAFPETLPAHVHRVIDDEPETVVGSLPPGCSVVIMTHSHALDQRICERALQRTDLTWCGLIGSTTKRRQFEQRLLARGIPAYRLETLICPIGVAGISGKHPAEIAIAVSAELLRCREQALPRTARSRQTA